MQAHAQFVPGFARVEARAVNDNGFLLFLRLQVHPEVADLPDVDTVALLRFYLSNFVFERSNRSFELTYVHALSFHLGS